MRMSEDSELHAFVGHENPSIVGYAAASGGGHELGDVCDPQAVAAFARAREIDIAMVSADEPLAAGVVDALRAQGTLAVGPTRAGAEIEWNKVFARELLAEVAPEAVPRLRVVREPHEVSEAMAHFGSTPVAVKPAGLTGGKGVKVMGPHLADHAEAERYVRELLAAGGPGESVLIEEKIVGAEFTIQAISDGRTVLFPPATYDYPYRFDGDRGPGTGGMGSLSMAAATLPFMEAGHYREACSIIERVIERLAQQGRHFSGVMNSGFFATADGVRVIEFNARFGDPECMNIMSLLAGSWTARNGAHRRRAPRRGRRAAARGRPRSCSTSSRPTMRCGRGARMSSRWTATRSSARAAHAFFSSAVQIAPNTYRTVGTSRAVALTSTAATLEQARVCVAGLAASIPVLEWRRDVGDIRLPRGPRRARARARDGRRAPTVRRDRVEEVRARMAAMLVERALHPQFLSNTYLVADGQGGPAFFIDAGGPVQALIDTAERLRARSRRTCCSPITTSTTSARWARCASAGRSIEVLISERERELLAGDGRGGGRRRGPGAGHRHGGGRRDAAFRGARGARRCTRRGTPRGCSRSSSASAARPRRRARARAVARASPPAASAGRGQRCSPATRSSRTPSAAFARPVTRPTPT